MGDYQKKLLKKPARGAAVQYVSCHLKSVSAPDNWQRIARTIVGRKNRLPRTRKPPPTPPEPHTPRGDSGGEPGENGEGKGEEDEEEEVEDEHVYLNEYNIDDAPRNSPRSPIPPNRRLQQCQEMYVAACREQGAKICNYLLRHLMTRGISLRYHCLGAAGARACAVALVDNRHVQKLQLMCNDVGPAGGIALAEMLNKNRTIRELEISDNKLDSSALEALCSALSSNNTVTSLCLSGNSFKEFDAIHVARLTKTCTSLTSLDLSHNCFRVQGGVSIGHALTQNETLETLDVSWNHLRMRGAVAIADSLQTNTSLTKLNVAWNGFHLLGSKALSKALKTNRSLQHLDLTCNRIDMECVKELLAGLGTNTSLRSLKIGSNPLTMEGALAFLKLVHTTPTLPIAELDMTGQCVDQQFITLLADILDSRPPHPPHPRLRVRHGVVLSQDQTQGGADDFLMDDPMMVLMEFMRIQNLRLVDLFTSLDKDGSRSLSYEEFRNGLMSVNIPMSEEAINRLIRRLDDDGDGEVDFRELISGQKEHKRKMHKLSQKQSHMVWEETELGRIHIKIKTLMALQKVRKTQELRDKQRRSKEEDDN